VPGEFQRVDEKDVWRQFEGVVQGAKRIGVSDAMESSLGSHIGKNGRETGISGQD
jgi:hypothetical protein